MASGYSRIHMGMIMLAIAKDGAGSLQIACGLGQLGKEVEQYLAFFVDTGALSFDRRNSEYRLTRKGRNLLEEYERLNQVIVSDKSRKEATGTVHSHMRSWDNVMNDVEV